MLISIHQNNRPLTVHAAEQPGVDALWIDFGKGQSIQLSAEEAAHLCTILEDGLAQLDARDTVDAERSDLEVIDSLPLFEGHYA